MQLMTTEDSPVTTVPASRVRPVVTFELIAYAVLLVLALVLRLAELDHVPLAADEAKQALAAWRVVYPAAPGSDIIPESPLLFLLHSLSFSTFGTGEMSVRWATALAGTLLVFTPLLFRDVLGRARTFALVVLLTGSPVLLIASRFDAPLVWMLVFAALGIWALRQYWLTQTANYALLIGAFFAAMLLLTDPGGLMFGVILLLAGGGALLWTRVEQPDSDTLTDIRGRFVHFPRMRTLVTAGLTVLAVSTIFGLYLPGLSAVSETLFVGLRAPVSASADTPFLYPLLVALFYEPLMWVFGVISLIVLARRGAVTLVERFLVVWLIAALIAALFLDRPEYALWITLPLAGLASALVVDLLARDEHPFLDIPEWGKPLLALGMVALLAIFTIHFQTVIRSFINIPGGQFDLITIDPTSGLWMGIALALILLGFFMVSSLWGRSAALRGGALGLLIFSLFTSLGAGWNAAVPNAANPVELWHTQTTSSEVFPLRDLLIELSKRETRGVPRIPVAVLAPDDGVVAWTLRDFTNTTFIRDIGEARGQEIILLPQAPEIPDLGGDYVGQEFVISRTWNLNSLRGLDVLTWWSQRRTRSAYAPADTFVLWLRQDIYNGVPFSEVLP